MAEFFNMGGYGAWVWAAYGIAALVMALIAVQSVLALRRAESDLAALEKISSAGNKNEADQ